MNIPREGWTFITEIIAIYSIVSQIMQSKVTIPHKLYKGGYNSVQQIQMQQCAAAQG